MKQIIIFLELQIQVDFIRTKPYPTITLNLTTFVPDMFKSNIFIHTISVNTLLDNPINKVIGYKGTINIKQKQ